MTDSRPPLGRILTFYSYKGGTGRSMAMANIAWILASAGRSVLMIDWDLEAPGLHRYFRPFLLDEELTASDGLIDLVDRYATAAIQPVDPNTPPKADWYVEYADFSDYVLSIDYDYFGSTGRLDFLPAGRQGDAYALKVSSFNWQNLYDRLGGGAFFEAFKRRAREEYDYVLIDSRTGVSDTAGICSVQMPDTLVVCFTYNNQSIKGAAGVSQWARGRHDQLLQEMRTGAIAASAADGPIENSPRPYRIFPVPMRVDTGESDRLALRQAFARAAFLPMIGHLGADLADYWSRVEVPHNVFYAYEEVLAPFKDKPSDPKTVLSAFVRMAGYITDGDVTDFRLTISPDEQQRFLEAFAVTALPAAAKAATAAPAESEDELLVRTAEAAFASLTDEQRAIARRVFGRLVRIGRYEEGGGLFPIRASLGDFSAGEGAVIILLERQGVLSVSTFAQQNRFSQNQSAESDDAGQTVGLASDRLLSLSKTLIGWIDRDRDFLLWRQQLRAYMADWDRSGQDETALLGGRLLSEATLWAQRRVADLNAAEREYIDRGTRKATLDAAKSSDQRAVRPAAAPQFEHDVEATERVLQVSRSAAPQAAPELGKRLPRWLGLATAAAAILAAALGWMFFFGSRSEPVGIQPGGTLRDAVIVAAATAATDPLQRTLLLLELGPDADAPANAKDLAIDLATTTLPWALLTNDTHPITVGRFGLDGNSFATGSSDGSVKVWRAGKAPVIIGTTIGATVSVALDPSRSRLFVSGGNHLALVYDLESLRSVAGLRIESNLLDGTMRDGMPVVVQPAAAGRNGTAFVAGYKGPSGADARPELFTVFRPEFFATLASLRRGTTAVRFNTTGEWCVAITQASLDVWELPGGKLRRSFDAASPGPIVLSPNGAYLGFGTAEGISVLSISDNRAGTREEVARRQERALAVDLSRRSAPSRPPPPASAPPFPQTNADGKPPFAVSPDGQAIVLANGDGSALAVPVIDGGVPRTLPVPANDPRWLRGHLGRIIDVDFSIDGSLIATSGFDGTSRLWRNPIGRPAPVRPPSSSSWGDLWKTLRDRTTACLSADERMKLLNEPEAGAREAAGKCDGDYGSKVFARPTQAS